jgi:hypothetical protein
VYLSRPDAERCRGGGLADPARTAAHHDPGGRIGQQTVKVKALSGQISHYSRVIGG